MLYVEDMSFSQLTYKYLLGEMGISGCCPDTGEKIVSNFSKFDISSTSHTSSKEDKEPCLWLGCRETEGNFFSFYLSCSFLPDFIYILFHKKYIVWHVQNI